MAEFDVVIRGGMVIDGTRMPRYRADVGIKDGKVAKIGNLKAHQAKKVVDAGGMLVAPGFVDLHTHYDAQLFWYPYCTISSWRTSSASATRASSRCRTSPIRANMKGTRRIIRRSTSRNWRSRQGARSCTTRSRSMTRIRSDSAGSCTG